MASIAAPARRAATVWVLLFLLLFQALGGIAGGLALSIRTDGSIMQMPVSQLNGSPFQDYRTPGLILLLVLGVFPLIALIGVWARRAWAWYASFAIGCALVIWILVEIRIVDYSVLQPVFGTVGALIIVVSLLPPVRRCCGVSPGRG
jgi:hypothetical protein